MHSRELIGPDSVGSRSKGKRDRVRCLSGFNHNKEKTMSGYDEMVFECLIGKLESGWAQLGRDNERTIMG
jgi:hypothetical protein